MPWWEWPPPLRDREPPALEAARGRLVTHIEHACLAQFAFERAWSGLRAQAHARGIRIFGDVPLFVSYDSAEVWTHRELFEVDPTGQCAAVVGVPPDAFSETGQFWGYPAVSLGGNGADRLCVVAAALRDPGATLRPRAP
jgi:4-alpha-glucanotransferase